jgi:hypothetical protein
MLRDDMEQHQSIQAPPSDLSSHSVPPTAFEMAPPMHNVEAAESAANRKLAGCNKLAGVVGSVVEVLSNAGSQLQHLVGGCNQEANIMDSLLRDEDPAIRDPAQGLLTACSSISVSLVSLAVSLSDQLQVPLEELQRAVESDRDTRKGELLELRQKHQACSAAVTSSLRHKDKVTAKLRARMKSGVELPVKDVAGEQVAVDADANRRRTDNWWFASSAEGKLRQAAALQTAATEALATNIEDMFAVSRKEQLLCDELAECFGHLDFALKQTLHRSFRSCADTWKSSADTLINASERLTTLSSHLKPVVTSGNTFRPVWAFPEEEEEADTPTAQRTAGQQNVCVAQWEQQNVNESWTSPEEDMLVHSKTISPFSPEGTCIGSAFLKDATVHEMVPAILRAVYAKQSIDA